MSGWRLGIDLKNWITRRPPPVSATAPSATACDPPDGYLPADRSAAWADDVPVTGRKTLPPDPRIMNAIGLNHTFESAVADIVDNSIDAGASRVLIRFARDGERLLALCVVDDGRGMDEAVIDRAMTIGGARRYETSDLGHFGIGLKAASLGQARVLTVVSRAAGAVAVGRRWHIESATKEFECDILATDYAETTLARQWEFVAPATGTVVVWTEVKAFPAMTRPGTADRFIDDMMMRLRLHLGLVFNRILAAGKAQIALDAEDLGLASIGLRFMVEPIDPLGYLKTGRRGYPRKFIAAVDGRSLDLRCHIWPGRSNLPTFRLPGGRPEQFQGFFVYRNGRLLQSGGWNGVLHQDRELQLARVEIDIGPDAADLFSMNAEKTRVEASPRFVEMVKAARDGNATFADYVEHAKDAYRQSRKRTRTRERPKVIRPGKGFAEAVRGAVAEEYDFLPGEEPLGIRWVDLDEDVFFDIDRENMMIRLNKRYRSAVIGGRDSSLNDAPLVKALIYLLAEETFRGVFLGAKTKDNIAVWQSILTAAAREETE